MYVEILQFGLFFILKVFLGQWEELECLTGSRSEPVQRQEHYGLVLTPNHLLFVSLWLSEPGLCHS